MHFWKKTPRFCVVLFIVGANFVLGEITWSVYQYEGMDDVYVQIRKAEARLKSPKEPHYTSMGHVCDGVIEDSTFEWFARNGFPTIIQGTMSEVNEQPPYLENTSIKRYNLIVPNLAEFVLDMGICTYDDRNKYFLTRGYEKDSLFFLFVFDEDTKILALRAIVQENIGRRIADDVKDIESSYVRRRLLNSQILSQVHGKIPRAGMQEDPICMLSDVDKLRLCIMVMNTPQYKSKYTFSPEAENVGSCKPTTIDLKTVYQMVDGFTFQCFATSIDNPSLVIPIHISRNFKNYEINTYTKVDDQLEAVKLDYGFKNIFFVREPYAMKIQALFQIEDIREDNDGQGTNYGFESGGSVSSVGPAGYHGGSSSNDAYAAGAVLAMAHLDVDGDGDGDGDRGGDK